MHYSAAHGHGQIGCTAVLRLGTVGNMLQPTVPQLLEVPMHARNGAVFRRLTRLMRAHGWEPIRIKRGGLDGSAVTDRTRGYRRKANKLPHPQETQEFPGMIDTSTPYIIGKVARAWRWTAGGPWRVPCVRLLLSAMRLKRSSKTGKRMSRTPPRAKWALF